MIYGEGLGEKYFQMDGGKVFNCKTRQVEDNPLRPPRAITITMTKERAIELLEGKYEKLDISYGKMIKSGFEIIGKYLDCVIYAAEHDVIYCAEIDELIKKGITEEDLVMLARCGYHVVNGEAVARFI